jgi:hypothetical protein
MKDILPVEIAYLKLAARRIFNYQKEAEDRGERYHDITAGTRLSLGATAKLYFAPVNGGHAPRLEIWDTQADETLLAKVACQVLDGPVTRYTENAATGRYLFGRST